MIALSRYLAAPVVALVLLSGCVLRPAWKQLADTYGFELLEVSTSSFDHVALSNRSEGAKLHLYIEGDGSPWVDERHVALDPTPSNPVLLRLMAADTGPAIYLGRPCYFGRATSRSCSSRYWTFERYGSVVTQSMCEAANALAERYGFRAVVLIGYSGGAAIAEAMRRCVRHVEGFVSIAGNLDPETWAAYHGYSRLVDLPALDAGSVPLLFETHWQCATDSNVPPATTDRYFQMNPRADRRLVDNCTHATGWSAHWPKIAP